MYGTAFYLKNPTPPGAAQEVPVTSELERYLREKVGFIEYTNRESKEIETVS